MNHDQDFEMAMQDCLNHRSKIYSKGSEIGQTTFYTEESNNGQFKSGEHPLCKMLENQSFRALHPYLLYMQFCGLFYQDVDVVSDELQDQQGNPTKLKYAFRCTLWKLYCIFMLFLNWTSVITLLLITLVEIPDMQVNHSIAMCSVIFWMLQNAINASVCHYLCHHNRLYHIFLEKWDTLYSCQNSNLRLFRNITLYICIAVNIANTVGWLIVIFEIIPGISAAYFLPFLNVVQPSYVNILTFSFGFAAILTTPSWTLPTGLFSIITLSVAKLFQSYNQQLRKQLKCVDSEIEVFRMQYQKLIQVLASTDENFGVYLFMMLLNNLVTLAVNIYRLLYFKESGMLMAIDIFWVISEVAVLLIICAVCARVNDVAHQCLDDLYAIYTEHLPPRRIVQISLFIQRLTGPSIGFTACGYFIITRSFVLTLVSAFLTYFLLLVQFGGPPSSSLPYINSTMKLDM